MAGPVPGQEGDALTFQHTDDDGAAGLAVGRIDVQLIVVSEAVDLVEAAAADDAYPRLSHGRAPPPLAALPESPRRADWPRRIR